jgi:hypothetical protein
MEQSRMSNFEPAIPSWCPCQQDRLYFWVCFKSPFLLAGPFLTGLSQPTGVRDGHGGQHLSRYQCLWQSSRVIPLPERLGNIRG